MFTPLETLIRHNFNFSYEIFWSQQKNWLDLARVIKNIFATYSIELSFK